MQLYMTLEAFQSIGEIDTKVRGFLENFEHSKNFENIDINDNHRVIYIYSSLYILLLSYHAICVTCQHEVQRLFSYAL